MCPGIGIGTVGVLLNRGGSVLPPIPSIEYVTTLVNAHPAFSERDGVKGIETIDGKALIVEGWSPHDPPYDEFPLPGYTTKEQYESDDGDIYIKLDDIDYPPRHNAPVVRSKNGTILIIGGDNNSGYILVDIWKRDPITKIWSAVTLDAGPVYGQRYGHTAVIDPNTDTITVIGGTVLDIIQSTDFGVTWVKKADLPSAFTLEGFIQGSSVLHGNYIYFGGGYLEQSNFAKVTLDGTTVTMLTPLPNEMKHGSGWCEMEAMDNRIWWCQGTGDAGNQTGIFWTVNEGVKWNKLSSWPLKSSHAAVFFKFLNNLYRDGGNNSNDINKVSKIPYVQLETISHRSLQKVNPDYTGPCVRIYKPGVGFVNIGFVNGIVDINTISALTGTVYVETIYDQFGTNNLTQGDARYMPVIMVSDILVIGDNGLPGIKWDSTVKSMSLSSPLNLSSKYCISVVMSIDSPSGVGDGRIFMSGIDGNRYTFYNTPSGTIHNNGDGFSVVTPTNFEYNTQKLFEVYRNRMGAVFYENGIEKSSAPNSTTIDGYASYKDTDYSILKIGEEYGFDLAYMGIWQEDKIQVGVIEDNSAINNQLEIMPRWNL